MKGLLDTHTFIWWASDPARLSARSLAFLQDPGNTLLLSVVSVWEILIKQQIRRLTLRDPLPLILTQQQANGLLLLPVGIDHVLAIEQRPYHHKDPFDRLLIAQAIVEQAVLVTADSAIAEYPVSSLW